MSEEQIREETKAIKKDETKKEETDEVNITPPPGVDQDDLMRALFPGKVKVNGRSKSGRKWKVDDKKQYGCIWGLL